MKNAKGKAGGLKLFNGRGVDRDTHIYVAARSRNDAARILSEAFDSVGIRSESDLKFYMGRWNREIAVYFSPNCWGNAMDGIAPERGVWVTKGATGKPERVWPPTPRQGAA